MAQAGSLVTDELRKLVGVESEPEVWEIEKGAIIKFAQSVEDRNPLWNDEGEARKTRYGGMIAPPTFTSMLPVLPAGVFPRRRPLRWPVWQWKPVCGPSTRLKRVVIPITVS